MALRLANKINRQLVKNVCRSLSAKRDIPELEPALQLEEASKPAEVSSLPPSSISTQYEVCRPRTIPVAPFPYKVRNENDVAKKAVAMQHLQPCMLPEYYKPPIEINSPCLYFDPVTETNRQSTAKTRKFEDSKTCANVTLPLRTPKLASPFPEPVKMMQSHTVSDQEKAEQMFAEARMSKGGRADNSMQQRRQVIRTMPSCRHYSNAVDDNKKCKVGRESRSPCQHFKVDHCEPRKRTTCKMKLMRPPCTKKLAPYPSYSESCYEEPYYPPSECRECPYKPNAHPTFKPPRNGFHTSAVDFKREKDATKGECVRYHADREPFCEEVKRLERESPVFEEDTPALRKGKKTFLSAEAAEAEEETEIPTKDNLLCEHFDRSMFGLVTPVDMEGIFTTTSAENNKSKCVKFPFKECPFEIVKERKPVHKYGECPPKPRRKLIKDCPPHYCPTTKRFLPTADRLRILMKDKCKIPPFNIKCPKFKMECENDEEDSDDPCRRKRKGKTLICPTDLLNKKKPQKKKTSSVVPFPKISSSIKSDTSICA